MSEENNMDVIQTLYKGLTINYNLDTEKWSVCLSNKKYSSKKLSIIKTKIDSFSTKSSLKKKMLMMELTSCRLIKVNFLAEKEDDTLLIMYDDGRYKQVLKNYLYPDSKKNNKIKAEIDELMTKKELIKKEIEEKISQLEQ